MAAITCGIGQAATASGSATSPHHATVEQLDSQVANAIACIRGMANPVLTDRP
jgi:hypothetical protein